MSDESIKLHTGVMISSLGLGRCDDISCWCRLLTHEADAEVIAALRAELAEAKATLTRYSDKMRPLKCVKHVWSSDEDCPFCSCDELHAAWTASKAENERLVRIIAERNLQNGELAERAKGCEALLRRWMEANSGYVDPASGRPYFEPYATLSLVADTQSALAGEKKL